MSNKNDAEVVIGGQVYTLTGYESEEYLQRVASYLNGKISDLNSQDGFTRLSFDLQRILLQINIADDYFKQLEKTEELKEISAKKEEDLYDIKHELISTQIKLENANVMIGKLQKEQEEANKKIIRLEAELYSLQKNS